MSIDSANPLRILHCIHSLSGGGAESQLRILTSVSHLHGMSSAICCVNADRHQIRTDLVRLFLSTSRNKYNLSIFESIRQAVDEFSPHILHAWLPASVTIPTMVFASIRRIPCVFSYRNAMHFHRFLTVPELVCAWLLSSQIVSNNPIGNSQSLYRWLYRRKYGVEIPNAVHIEPQFLKSSQGSTGVDSAPFTVLYAGRLVPQKNWRCLLQAVNALQGKLHIRLVICGEGPDQPQVTALIREFHLNEQVQMLGFRTDLHALMQQADAFVLPSWFEGMPNVLLEALAIGLPAIVSDIPSHRWIVGTTGCAKLFDPASADQLASVIYAVATSPTCLSEMVSAGRALAANRTSDVLAEQYRAMYRNVLERSHFKGLNSVHEMKRMS